jgi:hypothetical protein
MFPVDNFAVISFLIIPGTFLRYQGKSTNGVAACGQSADDEGCDARSDGLVDEAMALKITELNEQDNIAIHSSSDNLSVSTGSLQNLDDCDEKNCGNEVMANMKI